jgi:hypothetical protein
MTVSCHQRAAPTKRDTFKRKCYIRIVNVQVSIYNESCDEHFTSGRAHFSAIYFTALPISQNIQHRARG